MQKNINNFIHDFKIKTIYGKIKILNQNQLSPFKKLFLYDDEGNKHGHVAV